MTLYGDGEGGSAGVAMAGEVDADRTDQERDADERARRGRRAAASNWLIAMID